MTTLQLFHVYHSFFMKKWYIILYFCLFVFAVLAIVASTASKNEQQTLTLAIVDEDYSTETKLILDALEGGENFSSALFLQKSTKEEANSQLRAHKIDGYIVLEKGMTQAFYHNGELPIRIVLDEEGSMKSVLIEQVASSVYKRLIKSEAGILTYDAFYKEASDEEVVTMMMALLFTGLDTQKVFQKENVSTIAPLQYAAVSMYMVAIFLFFSSIGLIIQMNISPAMEERLSMYAFAKEKMMIAKYSFIAPYTLLFAIAFFIVLVKQLPVAFEMYNWHYALLNICTYIALITLLFIVSSLVMPLLVARFIKVMTVLMIFGCSGIIVPIIYFTKPLAEKLSILPFTQIFESTLQLTVNNYITTWHMSMYITILLLILLNVSIIVWRGKK